MINSTCFNAETRASITKRVSEETHEYKTYLSYTNEHEAKLSAVIYSFLSLKL